MGKRRIFTVPILHVETKAGGLKQNQKTVQIQDHKGSEKVVENSEKDGSRKSEDANCNRQAPNVLKIPDIRTLQKGPHRYLRLHQRNYKRTAAENNTMPEIQSILQYYPELWLFARRLASS